VDYAPLCEAWPVQWCCDLSEASPTITGTAAMAASEYVWAISGRQFGACEVLTRPCRRACFESHFGTSAPWWWDGISWPTGVWGWWGFGVGCGCASAVCSCTSTPFVTLPGPVSAVTEVTIDGEVLPSGTGWVLYDGFRLARVDGGEWPTCQDWGVPVSGVGAWSVKARYGPEPPMLGQLAVGQVACEIVAACSGGDCKLPAGLQSITRNGITKVFFDPAKLAEAGVTGFPLVDRFLQAVNPSGIAMPPAIWDPEAFSTPRRPGGSTSW
jgi:hypothetical protein